MSNVIYERESDSDGNQNGYNSKELMSNGHDKELMSNIVISIKSGLIS